MMLLFGEETNGLSNAMISPAFSTCFEPFVRLICNKLDYVLLLTSTKLICSEDNFAVKG